MINELRGIGQREGIGTQATWGRLWALGSIEKMLPALSRLLRARVCRPGSQQPMSHPSVARVTHRRRVVNPPPLLRHCPFFLLFFLFSHSIGSEFQRIWVISVTCWTLIIGCWCISLANSMDYLLISSFSPQIASCSVAAGSRTGRVSNNHHQWLWLQVTILSELFCLFFLFPF